jgi:hypothetical protein
LFITEAWQRWGWWSHARPSFDTQGGWRRG